MSSAVTRATTPVVSSAAMPHVLAANRRVAGDLAGGRGAPCPPPRAARAPCARRCARARASRAVPRPEPSWPRRRPRAGGGRGLGEHGGALVTPARGGRRRDERTHLRRRGLRHGHGRGRRDGAPRDRRGHRGSPRARPPARRGPCGSRSASSCAPAAAGPASGPDASAGVACCGEARRAERGRGGRDPARRGTAVHARNLSCSRAGACRSSCRSAEPLQITRPFRYAQRRRFFSSSSSRLGLTTSR